MALMAHYSGTCPECGGRWQPGDLIRATTDWDGSDAWVHAACPDVADPLAHEHPVCQTCWLSHPEGTCDR